MRLVKPAALHPGMTLANSIHDFRGQVVMREGSSLTESSVRRLVDMRIPLVAIEDPRFDDLEVFETVSAEVVRELVAFRDACRQRIVRGRKPSSISLDMGKCRELAERLVGEVSGAAQEQFNLVQYLPAEQYWDAHAVNGAALAVRLARTIGIEVAAIVELVVGAITHDLSLCLLPDRVLDNLGRLGPEEKRAFMVHPRLDAEILRSQGGVSAVTIGSVGQHHEVWNGAGYPRGLKGTDILPMARVLCLVDTYSALVLERPYRQRLMPHEAIEYVMGYAGELFDMTMAERFARSIPSYFVGTSVRMNDGRKGVVVYPNIGEIARPRIRLITNERGGPLPVPIELNLSSPENASLLISAVVDE